MKRDLATLVADSLDAPPELLPFLPELLADLDQLGTHPDELLAVLAKAEATSIGRALDLGCGKGQNAIAMAARFGCHVLGVDGMPAFLTQAIDHADAAGLADRCTFRHGDLREFIATQRDLDLVMMLALGDVLGEIDATIGALRRCVRPGGYVVIDDAWFDPDRLDPERHRLHEGLDYLHDHDETVALLQSHGDRVLAEWVIDDPEQRPRYEAMTQKIWARAEALLARLGPKNPAIGDAIRDYCGRQADEVELLCGPVVGALWVIEVVT